MSVQSVMAWLRGFASTVALLALLYPTSSFAMSSIKALFFHSGIQERLEVAIRSNDAREVERLLSDGAKINARGVHDVTPLMIAVDAQSAQAVAALLRAGANPNMRAADRAGPVYLAVESHGAAPSGHEILAMVMAAGGDPNTRRPDGDPVFARFMYDHDLDGLRWFRSLGADFDISSRTDRPFIADAAYGQCWDAVWVMIDMGARYDFEDTTYPLSKALNSPYASSPDGLLYPYKLKVWQFLKAHGVAVGSFVTLKRPGQP